MTRYIKLAFAVVGIAALAGPAMADLQERVSIDNFARQDTPVPQVQAVSALNASANVCWDNGPIDDVTAHQAQLTDIGFFQAADDFIVKHDFFKYIDYVEVCFLVSDSIDGLMVKPNVALIIYPDCDGRPDAIGGVFTDPDKISAVNNGPSAWVGYNLWTFRFEIQQFFSGYGRWWISPYGIGTVQDGLYFWVSANNGIVQGAQGQLKNGVEPWMDVEDCDCPGICTDFYFQIGGCICCLTKNNMPFDPLGGAKSLQLKGATVDTSRAVDNFQIGPYEAQDLCRVEAWMATNCPLDKVFLEIYANECNMPGTRLGVIDDPPIATDTGLTFNGCTIYHLVWPKITHAACGGLAPGGDYWLSVVARGTGSILDKAYWMYLQDLPCNLNITEAKVKDVFVEGLEDFTFISEATLGPPRDLAFKLYTTNVTSRVLATGTILIQDPESGGQVQVVSTVTNNFNGDFSKYRFDYEATNISFDPSPPDSNGLSGFQIVFGGSIPGIADQYAPPAWGFNCCGTVPPFGAEADIRNSEGFGIPIGGVGNFGYSVPCHTDWTDTYFGSWAHSWLTDFQVNTFDQTDIGTGVGPIVPIPAGPVTQPSTGGRAPYYNNILPRKESLHAPLPGR